MASGVRVGFGHAVRALRLGAALDADVWVSVNGPRPALARAPHVRYAADGIAALSLVRPQLVVIDTPLVRDGVKWLHAARRRAVQVVSIHDAGTAPLASDLALDGSIAACRRIAGARRTLAGPRYLVLDPSVTRVRRTRRRARRTVLIALGGGPRVTLACRIARALRRVHPDVRVRVAGGFAVRGGTNLPAGVEWLGAQNGLATALAAADVAVVAGGLTMYEAAAVGTPIVALPIVPGQAAAVREFSRRRLAIALELGATAPDVADAAGSLLRSPRQAGEMAARARRAVDGLGARRAAAAVQALLEERA